MPGRARLHQSQPTEEPDHSKFHYHPRDVEPTGAIKGCNCKKCNRDRKMKVVK